MDEERRDEIEEKQEDAKEERAKEEHIVAPKGVPPSTKKKELSEEGKQPKKDAFNIKSIIGKNKDNKLLETIRGNPWVVSTFVLGAVVLVLLFASGGITGNVIGEKDAGEIIIELAQGQIPDIEIVNVEKENGLYKIDYASSQGASYVYLTLDGKNIANPLAPTNEEPTSQDIPKLDKPIVELFIMTHCPYGTQAEKGFIPAIETLGNTIDAKIRFVHYFMHEPEETETPRQLCIREEQPEKYYVYLKEFLVEGDSEASLVMAGIDRTKLDSCLAENADKYYADDSALSEGYGVGGSPTLVVNGVIADSGRDSQSYLNTICSAFNDAPSECELELSSTSPSPMWGWEEGTDTGAQC